MLHHVTLTNYDRHGLLFVEDFASSAHIFTHQFLTANEDAISISENGAEVLFDQLRLAVYTLVVQRSYRVWR